MFRSWLLEEPELYFKDNKKCLDPQVGLLNFGPHGGFGSKRLSYDIDAAIIGTERSITSTQLFLKRLKNRISVENNDERDYKGVDFPGLGKSVLGYDIEIDKNCTIILENSFVRNLKTIVSREERILELAKKYKEKLDDLLHADPAPSIVFIPIDDEILTLCKEVGRKIDKIIYRKRELTNRRYNVPLFDFHNFIKAQAGARGFVTQIVTPKTLIFSEEKQSPATIAWNFSVGTYYKATGIPWKLSDIDDDTCYIGISFYNDLTNPKGIRRASIAQVYMRTGESQVISGKPFEWDEENEGRQIHLNERQMKELVKDSIALYKRQRKKNPRRIVVHKSSRFSDEELSGSKSATSDIEEFDAVHISEYSKFRAYHEKNDYPVVRGMAIGDEKECMLFTYAYIPVIGTYPGPSAPSPIHIKCPSLDTSIETICKDIMGLTKLDWNTSLFCTKLPVTIAVSEKVGDVLAEITKNGVVPPVSYKYYM